MSFFGLTEYQKISQYIFEETFNLRFAIPFEQHNSTLSMQMYESLSPQQKDDVNIANALDLELYDFAKKLMFQRWLFKELFMKFETNFFILLLSFPPHRFEKLKAKDNDFEFRFNNLGNLAVKNGGTEFNWDSNIDNLKWETFLKQNSWMNENKNFCEEEIELVKIKWMKKKKTTKCHSSWSFFSDDEPKK